MIGPRSSCLSLSLSSSHCQQCQSQQSAPTVYHVLSSGCVTQLARIYREPTKLCTAVGPAYQESATKLYVEYNLHNRFEIESCCNLRGNPRDLHVRGFGFLLDTLGRVRFLAFRHVESQCILDGFAYRLMLPVHVGARF